MKKKDDRQPQHPSRREDSEDEANNNDALEYYDTKKSKRKKIKKKNKGRTEKSPPEQDDDPVGAPPAPPLRVAAGTSSRPGAFRVRAAPPSLAEASASTASANPQNASLSNSPDRDCGSSMVVIPNASLVHGDEAEVSVAEWQQQQPELVHAAPLNIGVLQPHHNGRPTPKSTLGDTTSSRSFVHTAATQRSSDGGKGNGKEVDPDRVVLVLNKRWIFLLSLVCCLVVSMIVAGVSYSALKDTSDSDRKSSSYDKNTPAYRPPTRNDNRHDDIDDRRQLRRRQD